MVDISRYFSLPLNLLFGYISPIHGFAVNVEVKGYSTSQLIKELAVLIGDDIELSDVVTVGKDDAWVWRESPAGLVVRFQKESFLTLTEVATIHVVAGLAAGRWDFFALVFVHTRLVVFEFVTIMTAAVVANGKVVAEVVASSVVVGAVILAAFTVQWFICPIATIVASITHFGLWDAVVVIA